MLLCPRSDDCEGGAGVGARIGGLILGWFWGRRRRWRRQGAYSPAPGEVGEIFGVTEFLPPPDVLEVVRVEDLPGLADVPDFVSDVRVVSASRVSPELHLAENLLVEFSLLPDCLCMPFYLVAEISNPVGFGEV